MNTRTKQITAGESFTLHHGDNLATLKAYPDNTFDSVVTDPPYLLDFLGKEWDSSEGNFTPLFKECLRVLKPGGHLLAFSAARTYHKLATMVENAGFEIRDQLMWIYSSGFPKSQDVGKMLNAQLKTGKSSPKAQRQAAMGDSYSTVGHYTVFKEDKTTDLALASIGNTRGAESERNDWSGWGTQLKPAHEPIVMARKPIPKGSSIAKNCQQYGTGAINVDACRIATDEKIAEPTRGKGVFKEQDCGWCSDDYNGDYLPSSLGRFPSNVIGAVTGYEKFFYQPKVSRKERHCGMGDVEPFKREDGGTANGSNGTQVLHKRDPQEFKGNNHPTVKPVALMDYLIKLVTPPSTPDCQRKVLDPFMGSGSTGMAAVALGHHFTGCELDANYVAIAEKRITAWNKADEPENNFDELFEV